MEGADLSIHSSCGEEKNPITIKWRLTSEQHFDRTAKYCTYSSHSKMDTMRSTKPTDRQNGLQGHRIAGIQS